jgi:hypothetical protein
MPEQRIDTDWDAEGLECECGCVSYDSDDILSGTCPSCGKAVMNLAIPMAFADTMPEMRVTL